MAQGSSERGVSVLPDLTDDAIKVLEKELGSNRVTVRDLLTRHNDPDFIRRLARQDIIEELKQRRNPK